MNIDQILTKNKSNNLQLESEHQQVITLLAHGYWGPQYKYSNTTQYNTLID